MVYTEEQIFREAGVDRKCLHKWDARKYKEVWLAFCKWIVERFDKGKGVTIINFIRLSWQHDELEQEIYGTSADRALRPVWRLSESFERAYCLECKNKGDKRAASDETTFEKMEEVNFHKIAMRYSQTLTKDAVFSCLKGIISRIGKAMMTGQHVKIFCGVGDFVARDRKVVFEYDSHYQRRIIRNSSNVDDSATSEVSYSMKSDIRVGEEGRQEESRKLEQQRARGNTFLMDKGDENVKQTEEEWTEVSIGREESDVFAQQGEKKAGGNQGDEERKMRPPIYQGTESDETWRLERAKKQGGGPAIAEFVGEKLLQTTEALMEKDSDAQVRNMILGEERRVEALRKEEEKAQAARTAVIQEAPLNKLRVLQAEEAKRRARHEEKFGVKENPFYIHLEPDPLDVLNKKKQAQRETRQALEQQIAARLMTTQQENNDKLRFEQQQLQISNDLLVKTLHQEHAKQQDQAARLKNDWAKQVAHQSKVKRLTRRTDQCLVHP